MRKMSKTQVERYMIRKEKICVRMIEFTLATVVVATTAIMILLTGIVREDFPLAMITFISSGMSLLLFALGNADTTKKIMRRARKVCRTRHRAYVEYAKKIQDNCDFLDAELAKAKARRQFDINIRD